MKGENMAPKADINTAVAPEFGEWTPPAEKANPYLDTVDALIAHNEQRGDENGTYTLKVEAGTGKRQRVLFQQAAGVRGKTARVVESVDGPEGGEDAITFRLKAADAPRRKRNSGTVDAEAAE